MSIRNVFLYWYGKEYKLVSILRKLMYLHSINGKGYKIHLINNDNVQNYIKNIPNYFSKLLPAHKADFVRVNVICDYGGIWLDSDTIVLDSLDSLFDIIETKKGFFILENNKELCNGVFGSKKKTHLMIEWKKNMINILDEKQENISWRSIGISILEKLHKNNKTLYNNYKIFNGLDNLYPINWDDCVDEFINKPYENYKNIIRKFQPLVVIVNSVYKKIENKSIREILEGNMPINYFINKSIQNMNLLGHVNICEIFKYNDNKFKQWIKRFYKNKTTKTNKITKNNKITKKKYTLCNLKKSNISSKTLKNKSKK